MVRKDSESNFDKLKSVLFVSFLDIMNLSVSSLEVNFTESEESSALQLAAKLDEFIVFPILCFIAITCDSFFIATLYNMGVKRSAILLMALVAFSDIVQAIGLIGFVYLFFQILGLRDS